MSLVLVEEMTIAPAAARPRWRHVPQARGPIARPNHPATPGGRPTVAVAPAVRAQQPAPVAVAVGQGLQLTRRGLAVVMTVFLGAVAAGVLTLVAGFLAVSNEPVVPPVAAAVMQVG
ncbi:MAG: hypothetical protein QM619_16490 [Micropruina sp.]|uniref:hypothetical protein n=1 Tax=Micropruina sp. TaxID=2737536 RepID=UPI0039E5509F